MNQGTAIEANGRRFQLCHFTGRVTATRKQKEMKVKGSGGGSSGYGAYQTTSAVSITSQTIDHHELFLLNQAGEERSFHIVDFDFPCREGQTLSVVWIVPEGATEGPVVQVRNHNARETYFADRRHILPLARIPLRLMSFVKLAGMLVLLWMGTAVADGSLFFAWLLSGGGLLWLASALFRRWKAKEQIIATLKEAVTQLDGRLSGVEPLPAG